MTATNTMTEFTADPTNATPANAWDTQFAELRTRFPGTKDSVLL